MESDEELIELANKGDPDAFAGLYQRYRNWVYRLAWRYTGSREEALDVLQETFMYLLRKFPGFELTASMTTFLYPVVKHLSLAIRHKRRPAIFAEEKLTELPAPVSEEIADQRAELAAVLGVLPAEQREVLLMRFVDDMSLKEIGTALNVPVGTVKSRLYHALQKLREDRRMRDYFLQ